MLRGKKCIALLVALTLLLSLFGCSSKQDSTISQSETQAVEPVVHTHEKTEKPVYDPDATCSILIYMCGSNLETKNGLAGKDIDELLEADIPDRVNVLIETGGAAKWNSHGIASDKLQRYIVKDHALTLAEELDNQSMGDVNTFVDFLKWGNTNYPAQRNLLVIWDHGGDATKGVCYDENYGFKGLKQSDFRRLPSYDETKNEYTNHKFDMVIFDACLMGSIETAAWVQDFAHYMIASEVIVPGGGLDYRVIAGEFADNDDETFGKMVCDSFIEQCRAKGQEDTSELSLLDLAQTDTLLNEMEILFADNIADVQSNDEDEEDADVIRASEYSGASLYRMMADLYVPIKNETDYNTVDLYHYALFFCYDNDKWNSIKAAIESMVIYQAGDVSVQWFPELDPDYYENLCNGISMYFPLSFDRSELEDYIGICPIVNYAKLLDMLYLHVPDVALTFADSGSLDENGQFEIRLTDDSGQYLKEIGIKVWKQRNKDKAFIPIGTQTFDISENTDMTFCEAFTGEWYYLGDKRLETTGVRKRDTNYLTAPVTLNGESTTYNFSCTYDADGKPVFQKGTVGTRYDENGLIQRDTDYQPLKKGDIVEAESSDIYEPDMTFTVESDDITAQMKMLEPGTYRLQFIAVDVNNRFISSDYALYTITEMGVQSFKITKAE